MAVGTDEGEVSGHDHFGNADDPRNEQHPQITRASQGIPGSHGISRHADGEGGSISERASASEIEQQVIDADIERARISALSFTSGPIPDAAALAAYPPETQEKILDWHEREVKAMFDDESKRLDKLVDGEVRQGSVNQWLSFVINMAIVVGAIIAFIVTGNPNVFWSYTVLGAFTIGNVAIHIHDKKAKGGEPADDSE